jgi:hypothetical protein
MCDRNRFMFVTLVLSCLIFSFHGYAATVTVNADAPPESGIMYNSIRTAAENLAGGDTWGNGTEDTILVTDDRVLIEDGQVNVHAFSPGSSVTIRNNPGDAPIITLLPGPDYLFRVNESINVTYQGLTIIGVDGGDPVFDDTRAAFGMEAADPSFVVNVIIRDCVVTRNKGGNIPELDYTADFDITGTFQRAIYHGDDPYMGLLTCTVEDSVFAFFTPTTQNTAISFERQVAPENPHSPATRILTLKGVMVTKVGGDATGPGHGMRCRDLTSETTINIIDSYFSDCTGRGLFFSLNDLPRIGMNLNIVHSIIDDTGGTPAPINIDGRWNGTLTVDGATFIRPGGDMIYLEKQSNGEGTIVLKNIISVPPDDSIFYRLPDGTNAPASISVECMNTDGPAARGTQPPIILAAFAADYGGTGPFTADPMFLSTDIDSSYTGIRKWDSTTNTLYDVGNPGFSGKGTGGTNLVGGAECPSCSTTEVNDWALY